MSSRQADGASPCTFVFHCEVLQVGPKVYTGTLYIIHQFNWMRCDVHQAIYTTGAVVTFRVIK
jgi:hypothetical protein